MITIDGFITQYEDLKEYSLLCSYEYETNPYDGVVYPLINKKVPRVILNEVNYKASKSLGFEIIPVVSFLRRSPKGVHCPHPIHHDLSMGKYSLMLYLNDEGGTGIFRHKETGICYAPENPAYSELMASNSALIDSWAMMSSCEAKQNRAFIFDSGFMHGALPFGGFGEGHTARTVLTVFFND